MLAYLATRTARAALTAGGVVTAVFFLVRLIPGDPVQAILGDTASPEDQAALRQALHLDRSLPEQYTAFLGDVLDGSLGTSFREQLPVRTLIAEVLPDTLALAAGAMFTALVLGLSLGVFSAARHGTLADHGARVFAVIALAVPTICVGPGLILVFGLWLQWAPLPGGLTPETLWEELAVLVLPAITIGSALSALIMRQTRGAMLEALGQAYVTAAHARGVPGSRVLWVHALRNALLPVVTVAATQLGALLSGTVITEKIFERQGLGTLFLDAFFSRDIPVIQGTVLLVAAVYVSVNLLLDVFYAVLDPRVRLT